MYKCELCSKSAPPGIGCQKRVTQKRSRQYPRRSHSKQEWRFDDKKDSWKWTWIDDVGGVGWEIVKEINCCPSCAEKFDKETALYGLTKNV